MRFFRVMAWAVWRSLDTDSVCVSWGEMRFSWLITGFWVEKEITTLSEEMGVTRGAV